MVCTADWFLAPPRSLHDCRYARLDFTLGDTNGQAGEWRWQKGSDATDRANGRAVWYTRAVFVFALKPTAKQRITTGVPEQSSGTRRLRQKRRIKGKVVEKAGRPS